MTVRQILPEETIPLLIREGAQTIVIPKELELDWGHYYASLKKVSSLTKRVQPINLDKTLVSRIRTYFQPVIDWILCEAKTNEKDSWVAGAHAAFSLSEVAKFLYMFKTGVDYESQVDVDPLFVGKMLAYLTNRIEDLEVRIRLEQVAGILNLYERSSICTFTYTEKVHGVSMIDRIDDILDEAELRAVSKMRHSLGIPQIRTELRLTWLKTKSWYRTTLRKRKFGRLLRLSSETVSCISSFPGKKIQDMATPFFDGLSYRPPLVDLHSYVRGQILKERRENINSVFCLVPFLHEDLREYVQVKESKKQEWLFSTKTPW
jgi:hypothetical protein